MEEKKTRMVKVEKFYHLVTWTSKNVTEKRKSKFFDFKIFEFE